MCLGFRTIFLHVTFKIFHPFHFIEFQKISCEILSFSSKLHLFHFRSGSSAGFKTAEKAAIAAQEGQVHVILHIIVLFCLLKGKIETCPHLREEWLACATLCPTATKPGSRQGTRSLILSR